MEAHTFYANIWTIPYYFCTVLVLVVVAMTVGSNEGSSEQCRDGTGTAFSPFCLYPSYLSIGSAFRHRRFVIAIMVERSFGVTKGQNFGLFHDISTGSSVRSVSGINNIISAAEPVVVGPTSQKNSINTMEYQDLRTFYTY